MGPLNSFNHLLNFMLPAIAMALCMAGPVRGLMRRKQRMGFWATLAVHFTLGVLVLALGFWFFERDGKMVTYAFLAVCCATAQWWMDRGCVS